jgi:hypothetical protein
MNVIQNGWQMLLIWRKKRVIPENSSKNQAIAFAFQKILNLKPPPEKNEGAEVNYCSFFLALQL